MKKNSLYTRMVAIGLPLFLFFTGYGQTLERQVVASAGISVTSPLQIDYTIGEIAVTSTNVNSIVLTQGFQQPYFVVIPGNNVFPYLIIYPNPTRGNAMARFILPAPASLTVSMYNIAGQLIAKENVNYAGGEMQYIIKSGRFVAGSYFIQFAMDDGSAVIAKQLVRLE